MHEFSADFIENSPLRWYNNYTFSENRTINYAGGSILAHGEKTFDSYLQDTQYNAIFAALNFLHLSIVEVVDYQERNPLVKTACRSYD